MIRHIIKATNAEEIQAAIEAGTLTAPYLAYDSSANTANLVYPQGKTIPEVDYTEESGESVPIVLGNMFVTYRGEYGYLRAQINIPLTFNDSEIGMPKVIVIKKSEYDSAYESHVANEELTEGEFNASLLNNDPNDKYTNSGRSWYAHCIYTVDYPFGAEVQWVTEKSGNNDGGWIEPPTSGSDQYVVIAGQANYTTGVVGDDDVYNIGTYTLVPGVTDSPAVVWESIQEAACDQIPGPTNNQRGCWFRVAPNSVYDSVRYAGYIEGDCNAAQAIDGSVSDIRDASITAATNWNMTDENPFTFVKVSNANLGSFAFRLYNSATGAVSGTKYTNCFYVE